MTVPEALYAKRDIGGMVTTRYGSAKLGAVLVVIRSTFMAKSYLWQIGRLGVSYGPGGGVEAGLDELTAEQRGPSRIFYRKDGMALGVNWGKG